MASIRTRTRADELSNQLPTVKDRRMTIPDEAAEASAPVKSEQPRSYWMPMREWLAANGAKGDGVTDDTAAFRGNPPRG